MITDPKQKEELEKLNQMIQNQKVSRRVDPFETDKTMYNPITGDLYVTTTDKNGKQRRKTFNLLGKL